MGRISAIAVALTLLVTSISHASGSGVEYWFYPTGSPDPIGNIMFAGPPASSYNPWTIDYTANLDPNILSFNFDFTSVNGPVVTLGQFNNLFPIPGQSLTSFTGLEIDGGVMIGDSNLEQGQWGMSDVEGFDQARWISDIGGSPVSTATIYGNWQQVPEPATLAMLMTGGLAMLRRRR